MSDKLMAPEEVELFTGLGERLRWLRIHHGKTQSELAADIGMRDNGEISRIEAGKRTPTVMQLRDLANRLDCSTDYLVRGILTNQDHPTVALVLVREQRQRLRDEKLDQVITALNEFHEKHGFLSDEFPSL